MPMARRVEFVPYRPKTILNKHNRPDHRFWTRCTAYPYKGCVHGCEFCYCRKQCARPPLDDTYRPVFAALDAEQFQSCFMDWIKAVEELAQGQVIAVGGKTLRRSWRNALGRV